MSGHLRSSAFFGCCCALLLVMSLVPVTALADSGTAATGEPETFQGQDDGEPEIPPGAGRIIGSPDPGPDPEHSGDRGGWAQFATLGAIVAGVGFIMWRVASSARRTRGSTATDP